MAEAVRLEEALRNLLKDSDQRMGRWYNEYFGTQPYHLLNDRLQKIQNIAAIELQLLTTTI